LLLTANWTVEDVINTGNVTITVIKVNYTLFGLYDLGDLSPDENATISPVPYYIITLDDVWCCKIMNIVSVTGKDLCCKTIGPVNETDIYRIDTEDLEHILKLYSKELRRIGENITEHPDCTNLRDFESNKDPIKSAS
jgi:hypothetical protein